jgi:hypothetical protein
LAHIRQVPQLLGLALLVSGCSADAPQQERQTSMARETQQSGATSTADMSAIVKKIGLSLPDGAKIEFADYQTGHDDNARIVVSMSQAQWNNLSKQQPYAGADFSPDNNHHMAPDDTTGPWAPEKAPDLATAQMSADNGMASLNVGVSKQADTTIKLYIFWYRL